jgi:hypothetical protein
MQQVASSNSDIEEEASRNVNIEKRKGLDNDKHT